MGLQGLQAKTGAPTLDQLLDTADSIREFLDITTPVRQRTEIRDARISALQELATYPLLGPRFWGTRLNRQGMLALRQPEQTASPTSSCASHLTFFLRHSSQARDTLDRFLGGVSPGEK